MGLSRLHLAMLAGLCAAALSLQPDAMAAASAPAADKAEAPLPEPLLSKADTDASRLLPPPPAAGSAMEKAEVAELHAIQAARSPSALAEAFDSGEHEDASVFTAVLGPTFDLSRLPITARLLTQVRVDDSAAAKRAKAFFKRPRPWVTDATIVGCPHSNDKPLSSYPSGHATMIFSAAAVLAELVPERAQALMSFAQAYAHDRLVCGHHFQSDVVAGEVFGGVLASELLHRPDLTAEIAAARAELQTAGMSSKP